VTRARGAAQSASTHTQRIAAEGALEATLGRLIAVAESYPDVKANANFLRLQEELASTENRIAFARQHYNDSVMSYDTRRQSFPAVMLAGALGFEPEPYWKIEEPAQRAAPRVAF
jgi:LemA protein